MLSKRFVRNEALQSYKHAFCKRLYDFGISKGENIKSSPLFNSCDNRTSRDKNINQIQLAKELDVGKSIISLWEQNKCEPTLSKLTAMSKFFGVTIDYLAGLED